MSTDATRGRAPRLVLLGAPGSGKGTQASRLAERIGARHISTGEFLRAEVARGSELGERVRGYLDRGDLVPDDLLLGLALPLVAGAAGSGYILDGFPRSIPQAEALDRRVAPEVRVNRVIRLEVAPEELVRRMRARAQEQGRADDTDEVFQRRLAVYESETSPLVHYYARAGLLRSVDAEGAPDEVLSRIQALL